VSTQSVEAQGDYVWVVKENQKALYADVQLVFGPQPQTLPGTSVIADDVVVVRRVELGHGRLEERVVTIRSLLAEYSDWPYGAQAFMVERTRTSAGRTTRDVRYGITSAPPSALRAAALQEAVRGHWQIENGLHYRRDVP